MCWKTRKLVLSTAPRTWDNTAKTVKTENGPISRGSQSEVSMVRDLWLQMIGIHDIRLDEDIRQGLLAFHAVTGYDTTSQFAGITKKSAWKMFVKEPHLLHTLDRVRIKPPAPRRICCCGSICTIHQQRQPQSSMYAAQTFVNAKRTWTFCHRRRTHLCNICKGLITKR